MNKRILSCLLILALLLPMTAALAATTGDVERDAAQGETITLQATDFTEKFYAEPESGEAIAGVLFATEPTGADLIYGEVAYVAGTQVTLEDLEDGELRVSVPETAEVGDQITFPYEAITELGDPPTTVAGSNVVITVTAPAYKPQAVDLEYTVDAGSTVEIQLAVAAPIEGMEYNFAVVTAAEDFQHGVLSQVEGSDDKYEYTGTSVGTETFYYTVEAEGVTSDPASVTVEVQEAITPITYYDLHEHWAHYSAGHLGGLGLIVGEKVDGRYYFFPEKIISRSEFLVWSCSVLGIEPTDVPTTQYADDEDIPDWLAGFVNAGTEENLIDGFPIPGTKTTEFRGDDPLTRAQAIKILCQGLHLSTTNNDLDGLFNDLDSIPDWCKGYVRAMYDVKIIVGDDEGNLNADEELTRAQAIEMLYKCYKHMNMIEDETPEAPDEGELR